MEAAQKKAFQTLMPFREAGHDESKLIAELLFAKGEDPFDYPSDARASSGGSPSAVLRWRERP